MIFFTDKTIDSLQALIDEIKKYIGLQKEYVKLDIVQKLTILISTLVLTLVLIILGGMILFYLSFTLAYILEPHVGGLEVSYALISGIILIIIAVIYLFRKQIIIEPLTRFIANLFLNEK